MTELGWAKYRLALLSLAIVSVAAGVAIWFVANTDFVDQLIKEPILGTRNTAQLGGFALAGLGLALLILFFCTPRTLRPLPATPSNLPQNRINAKNEA